jgi:hypothetical protein
MTRALTTLLLTATMLSTMLLTACGPQPLPVLSRDDTASIGVAEPKTVREATERALDRVAE